MGCADTGCKGVVIEHLACCAPYQQTRQGRMQRDVEGSAQGRRPLRRLTQGTCGPVSCRDDLRGQACAAQPRNVCHVVKLTFKPSFEHRGRSGGQPACAVVFPLVPSLLFASAWSRRCRPGACARRACCVPRMIIREARAASGRTLNPRKNRHRLQNRMAQGRWQTSCFPTRNRAAHLHAHTPADDAPRAPPCGWFAWPQLDFSDFFFSARSSRSRRLSSASSCTASWVRITGSLGR